MFNPLNFISKFIKSSNQKELDRISKIVNKINSLEEDTKKYDDSNINSKYFNVFLKPRPVKKILYPNRSRASIVFYKLIFMW